MARTKKIDDRTPFANRMLQALAHAEMNQTQLAAELSVKPQTVQHMCSKAASSKHTYDAALIMRVNYQWLANGIGQMLTLQTEKASEPTTEYTREVSAQMRATIASLMMQPPYARRFVVDFVQLSDKNLVTEDDVRLLQQTLNHITNRGS